MTDLARALAYANAHGDIGTVELAPGTEPFTGRPPGSRYPRSPRCLPCRSPRDRLSLCQVPRTGSPVRALP